MSLPTTLCKRLPDCCHAMQTLSQSQQAKNKLHVSVKSYLQGWHASICVAVRLCCHRSWDRHHGWQVS